MNWAISDRWGAVRNVTILIEAARRFDMPIVVSQQYPKGLGATAPAVETALAGATTVHRYDKLEFSAACTPDFAALRAGPLAVRDQWIVAGMETHVCVYQSVRDLTPYGEVHVASDAVCSRTKANWRAGLALAERLGAVVTTTEICVFDLLQRAGSPEFKALSKAIK